MVGLVIASTRRMRGRVARSHMNRNRKKPTLIAKMMIETPGMFSRPRPKRLQPPKKSVEATALTVIILIYSAIW